MQHSQGCSKRPQVEDVAKALREGNMTTKELPLVVVKFESNYYTLHLGGKMWKLVLIQTRCSFECWQSPEWLPKGPNFQLPQPTMISLKHDSDISEG